MFSVVIPLFNKAQSINATLNSVLAQSFEDFEIVLVNDGSTDGSMEVAKQIQDPRMKIIEKENGGVSSARNRGILEAKYEWIAFLDGDDLWTKNHLVEFSRTIIANPELSWLFSGYTAKSTSKSYDFVYGSGGRLNNIFDDLLNGIKIHTSTVCVRKDLFTKNAELYFREGMNNSEDREVWYKLCFLDKSPYYINKSLSIYFIDVLDSLTKQNQSTQFLDLEDNLLKSNLTQYRSSKDQQKFSLFIKLFNKRALKIRYMKGESLEKYYNMHFSKNELIILKIAKISPYVVRKIILKLC